MVSESPDKLQPHREVKVRKVFTAVSEEKTVYEQERLFTKETKLCII